MLSSMNKKVANLRPADYNPRVISAGQLERLKKALAEYGDLGGVISNRTTGNLVGGHQRVKLFDKSWPIELTATYDPARADGTVAEGYVLGPEGTRFAYREVEWPLAKEKAANIAANQHGGEFDMAALKAMLVELDDGAFDLGLTGFDERQLAAMIDRAADVPMPDALPEESEFSQMTFIVTRERARSDMRRVQGGRVNNRCRSIRNARAASRMADDLIAWGRDEMREKRLHAEGVCRCSPIGQSQLIQGRPEKVEPYLGRKLTQAQFFKRPPFDPGDIVMISFGDASGAYKCVGLVGMNDGTYVAELDKVAA